MTPAARLQAAIEILDAWSPGRPMDRLLARWGRANRYAGSRDRAAVADLVHEVLRRRRSLAWPPPPGPEDRARVLALAAEAGDPEALFDGGRHAPAPPTGAERDWLAARQSALTEAPEAVRLDVPDDLLPRFRAALGERTAAVLDALRRRAPVDLRVNRLLTDPEAARAALAEAGVETEPGPLSPDALRVVSGARRLRGAAPYLDGRVELQDAASQAAARFARARPGERVMDYCAGGGGKLLALAADMGGKGELVAHDADPRRMAGLPERVARAHARARRLEGPPPAEMAGSFDLVFADAPCSGSGAWRRNPDAKWGLTPARLDDLTRLQGRVLEGAARLVRPGGRLVYATCSLLEEENGAAAAAFVRRAGGRVTRELRLTPIEGGDGFYAAEIALP
jgi:16S rRNA (cytosine967-C5)-methyltransferase